jgi:hypothetical protein
MYRFNTHKIMITPIVVVSSRICMNWIPSNCCFKFFCAISYMCVFVQCLANVSIISGMLDGYGKGQEAPTITFYMIKARINRYLQA